MGTPVQQQIDQIGLQRSEHPGIELARRLPFLGEFLPVSRDQQVAQDDQEFIPDRSLQQPRLVERQRQRGGDQGFIQRLAQSFALGCRGSDDRFEGLQQVDAVHHVPALP